MIEQQHIQTLVDEKLRDSGYFLLECSVSLENQIVVTLDGEKDVSIEKCTEISRYLESQLDREREDFDLQVTTYGADLPLVDKRQYLRYRNRPVHIITKEDKEYQGEMIDLGDNSMTIEPVVPPRKKGMKPKKNPAVTIDFELIKEIKPVLKF